MSVLNCFTAKIAAGTIKREAGTPIADELARLETRLAEARADADMILDAYADFLRERAEGAAREKLNAYRSIAAQMEVMKRFDAAVTTLEARRGDGTAPVALAGGAWRESVLGAVARSILFTDPHEIAPGLNVHYARQEARNEAQRIMAEAIEALRPKMLGFKEETALGLDVVRELFGEPTGNDTARRAAQGWLKAAEYLRREFNAAGGNIAELDRWLMPQSHDAARVASVTRDDWKDAVRPLLDRGQMLRRDPATGLRRRRRRRRGRRRRRLRRDPATGLRTNEALDDAGLERVLDQVYDSIVARGVDGGPTTQPAGRGALANQRAEARVLAFRDAESWLAYKERFGARGDVHADMMAHIHNMADDIGLMRVMGPNPEATHRYILSLFDREVQRLQREAPKGAGADEVKAAYKANRALQNEVATDRRRYENLYAEITGANSIPVHAGVAGVMGNVRTFLVGTQLGSAILSALSDTATMAFTARLNGLPVSRLLPSIMAELADPAADIKAAQLGLIMDSYANAVRQHNRLAGEDITSGRVAQVSGAVLKASGLDRWTRMTRIAFGKQMMAAGANHAARPMGEISEAFRAGLARVGISDAEWSKLADVAATELAPGARFLTVADVRAVDERLAAKWSQLIHSEMDYAVYDGNPMIRAIMTGQSRPGSAGGELRRGVGQYKGFAVNFLALHGARALAQGWGGDRMALYGQMFIMMTLLGAVSMQAKHIAQGRDPVSLDPTSSIGARAWGAAMLQGGGLGLFGDLMFQDKTRFGNSWATAIMGPQAALAEDALGRFIMSNVQRAARGEDAHFAGDALYLLGRYAPGTSLWFGRLAFQRTVMDQLALQIDPRAPERFARIEAEAARNFDQDFWWRPGEAAASRSPALSAIGGQR